MNTAERTLVRPEVQRLVDIYKEMGTQVTLYLWERLVLNSYERFILYPCLDDEALLTVCELCNANIFSGGAFPATYNEVVEEVLFPLLIQRLKDKR